jgi:hypothetical protein
MPRSNRITLLAAAVVVLLANRPAVAQSAAAQSVCSGEILFTDSKPVFTGGKLTLSLFGTVSKPAGSCLPAEIRLMAAFFDNEQNLICSGVIESMAMQNSNVQNTSIELRPLNMVEFVRLKSIANPPPKRLFCLNPENDVEVAAIDVGRAATLRLRVTLLPKNGGLATTEIRINF